MNVLLIEVTYLTESEMKSFSVVSGKKEKEKEKKSVSENEYYVLLFCSYSGCEGLAILPRSECIDYVNAVGKKDADMTLQKGCIRE